MGHYFLDLKYEGEFLTLEKQINVRKHQSMADNCLVNNIEELWNAVSWIRILTDPTYKNDLDLDPD